MRPSDEDFRWMAGAALREEATRARAAEVEKGAKLREAETIISQSIAALGGDYAPEQVPEAIKQAFALMEKVEQERDAARHRLEDASRQLHARLCGGSPYETCEDVVCVADRSALGEKP